MRRLETLLVEARNAITVDLISAGPDEVEQHPSLQSRARLVDRIDRFLASVRRADTSDPIDDRYPGLPGRTRAALSILRRRLAHLRVREEIGL